MKILKEPDLSVDAQGRLCVQNGHFDFADDPEPDPGAAFADKVRDWALAEANRRLAAHTEESG